MGYVVEHSVIFSESRVISPPFRVMTNESLTYIYVIAEDFRLFRRGSNPTFRLAHVLLTELTECH